MDIRHINRTDSVIIGTCILSLILFSINTKLDSTIILYVSNLVALGAIIYQVFLSDAARILRQSLIIGVIGGFFYTYIDSIFVDGGVITYLRKDINIFKTPVSVALLWMYFATIMLYLYQRLRSKFARFYIPSLLTGVCAFLLGFALNYLGDYSRLWIWNIGIPPLPSIGPVPLFVPLGYFLAFTISPYIIGSQSISMLVNREGILGRFFRQSDNPIVGGVRCAVVLSMSLYILYRLFSK